MNSSYNFRVNIGLSASAGSGKTRALTNRLLTLLLSGVKPSEILVVTFTNMAASDIKEKLLSRLNALASGDSAELKNFMKILGLNKNKLLRLAEETRKTVLFEFSTLQISTIHSFLLSLLQAFPEKVEFPISVNVIDEVGKGMMLIEVIEEYYRILEKNKNELRKIRDFALEYSPRPIYIRRILLDIYEKVRAKNPSPDEIEYYKIDELERKYFKRKGFVESDRFEKLVLTLHDFIKERMPTKYVTYINGFLSKLSTLAKEKSLSSGVYDFFSNKLNDPLQSTERCVNYLMYFFSNLNSDEKKIFSRKLSNLRNLFASILDIELQYFTCMWMHFFKVIDEIYRKKKSDIRSVDFNDIETYALNLVKSILDYHLLSIRLDKNIKYLLIDEFQDTSIIQWETLRRIASECNNKGSVFIVADVKQSIYRWRGGEPELFERVRNEYNMEKDTLHFNYRQSGRLLEFVNKLFQEVVKNVNPEYPYEPQKFPIENKSRKYRGYVRIEPLQSGEIVCEKVVEWINQLHERGIEYNEIAVLCRRNNEIEVLERVFILNKIPFVSQGKSSILTDYCIRDILNILKMLSFPKDNNYTVSFMRSRIMRIDYPSIQKVLEEYKSQGIDVIEYISKDIYEKIKSLQLRSYYRSMSDLLIEIYGELEVFEHYPDKGEVLVDFLEIIYDFERSYPGATIEDFILFLEEFGESVNFRNYDLDGVILQTIHSSKGLEYHTVILPFINQKIEYEIKKEIIRVNQTDDRENPPFIIPGKKYFDYLNKKPYIKDTIEKERRNYQMDELNNLYVALTRAKENLILFPLIKSKNENSVGKMILDLMTGDEEVYELGVIQGRAGIEAKKKRSIVIKKLPILISGIKKETKGESLYYREDYDELFKGKISHEHSRMARLIGLIFHRAISRISEMESFERNNLFSFVRSALDADSMKYTIEERNMAIGKACILIERCLQDKRIKRFFSEKAVSEVDLFSKKGWVRGSGVRVDRVLFDEKIEFLDFKTVKITDENDIYTYKRIYDDQMKTYHLILSSLYPDREVFGYIYFVDGPYDLRLVGMF